MPHTTEVAGLAGDKRTDTTMATGPGSITKDPSRPLTLVRTELHPDGVNRHTKIEVPNTDASCPPLPQFEPETGTDAQFQERYTRVPTWSGDEFWTEDEVSDTDPQFVWTSKGVPGAAILSAGFTVDDRSDGVQSYVVTEEAHGPGAEEYWNGEWFGSQVDDSATDALDRTIDEETRAGCAREAIEVAAYEWAGFKDLTDAQLDEFYAIVEDDDAVIDAIDGLGELSWEDRQKFGGLVAEKLWLNSRPPVVAPPAPVTPAEKPKNGYITMYKGKKHEVYANTTLEAQRIAAEHFKVAKSAYKVDVYLAELAGEQVTHTITN